MRLVIDTLFSCAEPFAPYPDSMPAHAVPGIFGHVAGYLGVVEPQMRKALHIHFLVQLHGFSHPQDLITSGGLADIFRRIWHFVASICFRSVEGFAAYLGEPAAMEALREKPLLPITPKQRGMIGANRTAASIAAQKRARRSASEPPASAADRSVRHSVPNIYADATKSSGEFAAFAVGEVNAGT